MMPFAGGIDSLSNGTLIISVGAALLTVALTLVGPSWRRALLAAGAVFLLAVLVRLEEGSWLLSAALLAAAAGNALVFTPGIGVATAGLVLLLGAYVAIAFMFSFIGTPAPVLLAAMLVVAGDMLRLARTLGNVALPPLFSTIAGWLAHYAGLLTLTLAVLLA